MKINPVFIEKKLEYLLRIYFLLLIYKYLLSSIYHERIVVDITTLYIHCTKLKSLFFSVLKPK